MGYGMASPTGQSQRGNSTGNFKEKRPHGYQKFSMANFTPEMMDKFMEWMQLTNPEGDLSRLAHGDEEYFNQIEAPALKQFSALQGNLASRFSGQGMGARHSSGFQNTVGQAGSDFAQQLQANRQGLQRQAQQDLSSMYSNLLGQKPYDQGYVKKDRSGGNSAEQWGRIAGLIPGTVSALNGGGSFGDAFKGASSIFSGGF